MKLSNSTWGMISLTRPFMDFYLSEIFHKGSFFFKNEESKIDLELRYLKNKGK